MTEELYNEEEFYNDNGWPPEEYSLFEYTLPVMDDDSEDSDYDQFALITNTVYPYIRLTKRRGKSHIPCGGAVSPATDGWFASKTEQERDSWCPKIAWGFAAVFLANLKYDCGQMDYIPLKNTGELIRTYYNKYLTMYLQRHNGLKYKSLSIEQKELNFIEEHEVVVRSFWEKSEPLKAYVELYEYARDAEADYECFLQTRKDAFLNKKEGESEPSVTNDMGGQRIINQNGNKSVYVENNTGTIIIGSDMQERSAFSTEIRETFGKPYIKVFFLDDTMAERARPLVEALNCVKTVNITLSESKAHPGNTLTVYPKPMVNAQFCENEIREALNKLFSNTVVGELDPHNEAFFADMEKRILEALDNAMASIDVCVAWFSNPALLAKLLEKKENGLEVRVIIYQDGINHRNGVDLSGLDHKELRGERGGIMHEKFCVIDGVTTISGSYNWTRNAEHNNDEDVVFHVDEKVLSAQYRKHFFQMWQRV